MPLPKCRLAVGLIVLSLATIVVPAISANEPEAIRPLDDASSKPVKVFILAGQSNMEGHGFVDADPKRNGGKGSLEYLTKDPATADRFKFLLGDKGKWSDRDDVSIHYLDRKGKLTVGYGANRDRIGPELGFGHVVGDAYAEPVLLIKLAWGGKSLAQDFRPPSSGGEVGTYYREIVRRTKELLDGLNEVFPEFGDREYELAGFGWHQGWNDRVNQAFNDEYEQNLANFIRDIRHDLGVKSLPFVIAETGMTGPEEKHPRALSLMKAQAAVADYKEFQGNVAFVATKEFWRDKDVSPTGQGYHWNTNAETYYLIGEAMGNAMKTLCGSTPPATPPEKAEMAGYLLVPHAKVEARFNAGFSMYVAAWPLLQNYPGQEFQSGLFGTWMFSQYDGPKPEKAYSDIEGGLGWWRDTRFATETPKFIMGGVALNFSEWANGPGAGKGRDWRKPAGHYAVAQLSPWVLWPPDGLNLKQGTCGELVGYGYLPLPLTTAKKTTAGKDVPSGNQCWTLFLNTGNFKGPVTFFLPYFWSKPTVDNPKLAGLFLDSRPSEPNKAVQMETQHIPAYIAKDAKGDIYTRVAPTRFPGKSQGEAPLIHRITAFSKAALWDRVEAWFNGGPAVSGEIDTKAAAVHAFKGGGGATWQIYPPSTARDKKVPVAWNTFATPTALDNTTYGYKWASDAVTTANDDEGPLVTLPEYFRLEKDDNGKERWVVVNVNKVPAETGLAKVDFPRRRGPDRRPYVTPDEADSCWKKPGPAAGPFEAQLGDGSVVTYYWYRFADQPALLNADLTADERESLQKRVELLHKNWTKDREYLPPPTIGKLAHLDPVLLVTAPAGLEIGYVPIVTRQALSSAEPDFKPDQSQLPVPPPKEAIVLLDEKGNHSFLSMAGDKIDWPVEDGVMTSTSNKKNQNHIVSTVHFKDADIHVEFLLPEKGTGNSGVYIHGNYEIQILNSFGKGNVMQEDAGALYGFSAPIENACRKPGEWQVFDIRYRAPRRDEAGKITENGTVTVWFNGKKVQDGTRFGEPKSAFHPFRFGTTPYLEKIRDRQKKTMIGPLFLQDHGNPVKFRNVWILTLDEHAFIYEPNRR